MASTFHDRLRAGELMLMMGIRNARTADTIRIAHATGHAAVMIDLEHSAMPVDVAAQLCAAARDIGVVPLVRIPEREYGVIGRLLDGGAHGIVVPRVESVHEAATVAGACRFPPRGHRSQVNMVPHRGMRPLPAAELNPGLDSETVVVSLLETPAGIAHADDIAALDGVDILAIGANDLTAELGSPGDVGDPEFGTAVDAVAAACRKHGKLLMLGGIADPAVLSRLAPGDVCPLFLTGNDSDLLYTGSLAAAGRFTEWFSHGPS
jgi:2-keto-3-deoxy-L-rhamnonate aldolase RhmA